MKRLVIGLSLCLLLLGRAFCATIHVPADYARIDLAVAAAKNGDEIVISPGEYGGFSLTKRLTIRSTFDGKDWSIIENTRIKSGFSIPISFANGSVIRGLRIGYDPITSTTLNYDHLGILGGGVDNVTIEYCIIENCCNQQDPRQSPPIPHIGAAIIEVSGVIQNNIIRNNKADGASAMAACGGIIRNNLIYSDQGYDVGIDAGGATQFINNTIYSTAKVGASLSSLTFNANNIYWQLGSGSAYASLAPRNCIIKGYTGSDKSIITADPKFVDPANGDFHLQASSPCIDAGITTSTVKADIVGVQRGLKASSSVGGDGSGVDIGAYEYKPKPVSVWLPNGGPDQIRAGNNLTVAWEIETQTAGTSISLQLFNGEIKVADLGSYSNPAGADESIVLIPGSVPSLSTYFIRGISSINQTLYSNTPLMTIMGINAVRGSIWARYL